MPDGTLYVVATPIGNLEDITFRAISTLKKVDFIACEDTRQTQKLLARYGLSKPLISYHQHSRLQKINFIIDELLNGKKIALVSDAGTPAISDPGARLVDEAWHQGINVEPIPGPSALTATLSTCGFSSRKILFLGFLPKKKGRQTLLKSLRNQPGVIVIYESPYRIMRTLKDLHDALGEVKIYLARELTKQFEQNLRGKISEIISYFKKNKDKIKGEFVICLYNGNKKSQD